jgi:hypothetical protein
MPSSVPYTTKTGVQIGLLYEPPKRNYMSADQEKLQEALLRTPRGALLNALANMMKTLRGNK